MVKQENFVKVIQILWCANQKKSSMTLNRLLVNGITNSIKLLPLMVLRQFWLMIAYTKILVGLEFSFLYYICWWQLSNHNIVLDIFNKKNNKLEDTYVGKGDNLVSNSTPLVILKKNRCKWFLVL